MRIAKFNLSQWQLMEGNKAIRKVADRYLSEALNSSDGIFYTAFTPQGWQLFGLRFTDFEEQDHTQYWETEVAPILAHMWQKAGKRVKESQLIPHVYGFPRGRIGRQGMKYVVYTGNDLGGKGMPSKPSIETYFGVIGARWESDEHERCQKEDRDALRALLGIKHTWPAVSFNFE